MQSEILSNESEIKKTHIKNPMKRLKRAKSPHWGWNMMDCAPGCQIEVSISAALTWHRIEFGTTLSGNDADDVLVMMMMMITKNNDDDEFEQNIGNHSVM